MDFGMWRRVLLVLFFVVNGLCASKNNEEVFRKLCHIAGNVSALMEKKGNSGAKSTLEEALYGGNGQARFYEDGTFNGWCGLTMHSRSDYCSHIQPGGGSTNNGHGCFGRSLLGTFLCLCTKGTNGDEDLCGLGKDVGGGARWVSGLTPSGDLFQKVWEKINKKCTENKNRADLENLQTAVKEIHEDAKEKKVKNGYFTLGSTTTNGICSGTSHGDACVTYKANGGNEPNIPWANKIKDAIQKLKETQSQTYSKNSAQTDHQEDHEGDDSLDNSPVSEEQAGEEEGDEEEEVEETTENTGPHNISTTSRPRRKRRDTTKKPTEQHAESLKAIIHKDDATILPQPFWLLSAVFFF